MSKLNAFIMPAAAVTVAAVLAACAGGLPPYALPGERAAELPPEKGLIMFKSDAVGAVPARRVQYADNEHRVDYALYRGGGAQAEFVYMETLYQLKVSYIYQETIADHAEAWNYTRGQPIQWDGEAGQLNTRVGWVHVRPFRLTAKNQSCFGVSGEWDTAVDDPNLRPTRLMFGYYCAAPGRALATAGIPAMVDNLGIRGVTERAVTADRIRNFYADVEAATNQPAGTRHAIEVAQGPAAPDGTGIRPFPFDHYIEYYVPGDSSNSTVTND